jgi:outer membrane protein assembly factor BamB
MLEYVLMFNQEPKRNRQNHPPTWIQSWWLPLVMVAIGCLLIVGIHAGYVGWSERPSLDFFVVVMAIQILFACWVWFCSGISANWQAVVIVAFVLMNILLTQLVRLEGFAGDGRPIWTWRWSPDPHATIDWKSRRTSTTVAITPLATESPHDFPAFRGRYRDGRIAGVRLATDWEQHPPRLLWKQPMGAGWSSFAVAGKYCFTQEQRGDQEATVCYEINTGRECWVHAEHVRFSEPTSGVGPRATPTIAHGNVYSLGATGILNCLDLLTGKPRWTINILQDNATENILFGVTASPLVQGSLVIVNPGGRGSSLAAYDAFTGKQIWRSGDAGASYSSPHYAKLSGRSQILNFNAEGLYAHDIETGTVLWQEPWISNPEERNNVCQPVVIPATQPEQADQIFIASGYGMGCAIFEVRTQADQFFVNLLWRNRHLKAKFSSVVEHNGYVYGFDDAILTCLDLSSGERCWKGGRYGYGQLILCHDSLLVQMESGEIALVHATPERFQEWGRFSALSHRTWNHPVLAGNRLLVRNDREAACFELEIKE